jgi:hypothetical protein
MKVSEALLCVNCDEIFRPHPGETACPACLSKHVVALKRWIKPLHHYVDIEEVKARSINGTGGTRGTEA